MATRQQRLTTNLKSAQDGLDQSIACLQRVLRQGLGELLAEHHVSNLSDLVERVKSAREYVHDVIKDPEGKDDL